MATINPKQLEDLRTNIDLSIVLKHAPDDAILLSDFRQKEYLSLVKVAPETLFLRIFAERHDVTDLATRNTLDRVTEHFDINSSFADVTRRVHSFARGMDDEEFRYFLLLNATAITIGGKSTNLVNKDKTFLEEVKNTHVMLSDEAVQILRRARLISETERGKASATSILDYLRAMLSPQMITQSTKRILSCIGVSPEDITNIIQQELKNSSVEAFLPAKAENSTQSNSRIRKIKDFGTDLNEKAKNGKLEPVIGRESEIDQLIEVISQYENNSCILIGEPGVGKSAVINGFVYRIVTGQVPDALKNKWVFELDTNSMEAGTMLRGSFEQKLEDLIRTAEEDPNMIIVVNEIHTLVGAGKASGVEGAANPIKRALDNRSIGSIIGSTTLAEYRKHIEKDEALAERLPPIIIEEPDRSEIRNILSHGKRPSYQLFHGVKIPDECIESVITAADSWGVGHSPRREIKLLDRVCTAAKIKGVKEVTSKFALEKIAEITKIPANLLSATTTERIDLSEKAMLSRVVGQTEAIYALTGGIRRSQVGLKEKNKPIYSAIFAGGSGVGKTEVCRQLAETFYPAKNDLLRFDMSEYMEPHSVSRLIGSPPGYVGSNEGGLLVNKVRAKPYCVVLFDEVEKAHPDVLNILLQLLEEGMLTDSKGNIAFFNHTIVILTTNVGSSGNVTNRIGFNDPDPAAKKAANKAHYDKELKRVFTAALRGRVDDIIIFNQLSLENSIKIAKILLNETTQRLLENIGIQIRSVDDRVYEAIAKASMSEDLGTREMKNYIKHFIETPLSQYILYHGLEKGDTIDIFLDESAPDSYILKAAIPAYQY